MLGAFRAIYTGEKFSVHDAGVTSGIQEQHLGICQGCPLSHLLFAMATTVLLHDARGALGVCMGDAEELVHADDT
eukprot:5492572-Pyramimonas_sp.AAC.1